MLKNNTVKKIKKCLSLSYQNKDRKNEMNFSMKYLLEHLQILKVSKDLRIMIKNTIKENEEICYSSPIENGEE